MQVDAARYLKIYDTNVIYSWSLREFENFMMGARLSKIDEHELAAVQAIFYTKAKSKKRIKGIKDIYDAEKARKELLKGTVEAEPLHLDRYLKAKEAMKNYRP